MGRGVTIKNLLVSYYGRNPLRPNADTVLQHARMYGYRQRDIGMTRLFLPPNLASHFRLIHQMESALRDLVKRHPEGQFEGIYLSAPLQPTRRNVLDPSTIGVYVAGNSYNPSYPMRNETVKAKVDWLDERLKNYSDNVGCYEIPIENVINILEHVDVDPKYPIELWQIKILREALLTLKYIGQQKAYIVVRRNRILSGPRGETKQIISGGEESLAPNDAVTLFIYRQQPINKGEISYWWPQLRFPMGNYVLAFSFIT